MKRLWIVIAVLAVALIGCAGMLRAAGPSDADLDADIALTKAEIADAEHDAAGYSGGAILIQIRLREAVLRNTLAMLQQKRSSILRGIVVTYVDTTSRLPCVIDNQSAQASLQQAKHEAEEAGLEAAQYSGGLVKIMALVRQATGMATVAAIEQQIAFMKLGISLPTPTPLGGTEPAPPGKPSSDKDAL